MSEFRDRITDLSRIEPENFKARNEYFLNTAEYEVEDNIGNRQEIRDSIWRVRNGDLDRTLEEFPTDEPVLDQCAGWMHAVVGKHFFPDANHRTAMSLLRKLLRDNGMEMATGSPKRARDVSIRSHEVRKELDPITLDNLYEKDKLFLVWRVYFEGKIIYA